MTIVNERSMRIVVFTGADQLDADWIRRLAAEPDTNRLERVGVAASGLELVWQTRPDVVIVDRPVAQTEQLISQIYASLPSVVCIALVEQQDMASLRRLMLAGARDVLAKPVRYSELVSSVRRALDVELNRRRQMGGTPTARGHGRGKLTAVISPKGGAGTTFIATNLAVALRQLSGSRVALADLALQFGHVGTHLNLWSRHTLADLVLRSDEIDDELMGAVMQSHSSGVDVLLAPTTPELAGEVTGAQIDRVLDALLERYDHVIVDTWSFLDEITLTLLAQADHILVVTTPEVPALKNARHFLDYLRQHNILKGSVSIVLNRFPSVDGIALEDVQQHLRQPVSANIPSAGEMVTYSINRGIPLVMSNAQSWAAVRLRKLAAHIAGEQVELLSLAPNEGKEQRGWFGGKSFLPAWKR